MPYIYHQRTRIQCTREHLSFNIFGIKLILQGNDGTHSIPVLHMLQVHTSRHLTKMEVTHATKLSLGYRGSSMYLVELHAGFQILEQAVQLHIT